MNYVIEPSSWGIKNGYKVYLALKTLGKASNTREITEYLKRRLPLDDRMRKGGIDIRKTSSILFALVYAKRIKLISRGAGRKGKGEEGFSIFCCFENQEETNE
jgi:hypothetical protein